MAGWRYSQGVRYSDGLRYSESAPVGPVDPDPGGGTDPTTPLYRPVQRTAMTARERTSLGRGSPRVRAAQRIGSRRPDLVAKPNALDV